MKASQKKTLNASLLGLALAALIAGTWYFGFYDGSSEDKDKTAEWGYNLYSELQGELADKDEAIDEMVMSFDKIDANLEVIREKENRLREYPEGEEVPGDQKERILRDIQVINTLMAENRSEMARLRKKLSSSGVKVKSLEDRLARMEQDASDKDVELEALRVMLEERDQNLAGLRDTLNQREMFMALQSTVIDKQDSLIYNQDKALNTVYFTSGTYKELKDRGVVEKKGDLLGLGGKKTFTADADKDGFIQIDLRDHTSIPVFAKRVELVTTHPEGSYEMSRDEDGEVSTIDILDPEAFWESSKYLVVATN